MNSDEKQHIRDCNDGSLYRFNLPKHCSECRHVVNVSFPDGPHCLLGATDIKRNGVPSHCPLRGKTNDEVCDKIGEDTYRFPRG